MIPHTRTYATLTTDERKAIMQAFDNAMAMGATDAGHACAIAANDAFGLTARQWNSNIGGNCFAMVVAVVFFAGQGRIPNPTNTQSRFPNIGASMGLPGSAYYRESNKGR